MAHTGSNVLFTANLHLVRYISLNEGTSTGVLSAPPFESDFEFQFRRPTLRLAAGALACPYWNIAHAPDLKRKGQKCKRDCRLQRLVGLSCSCSSSVSFEHEKVIDGRCYEEDPTNDDDK